MDIEKSLPIILILGAISLYFLVTGVRALVRGRMRVLNPLAHGAPISLEDLALEVLRKKVQDDYRVPEGFIDRSGSVNITGGELWFRAWLHIVFGVVTLLVLAVFLRPDWLDLLLGFSLRLLDMAQR